MKYTVLAAAVLIAFAGLALRIVGLSAHGCWGDEGITTLRVAGNTSAGLIRAASGATPITAAELASYSWHGRNDSAPGVVASLAAEDPQHVPLYFVVAHEWERVAGAGVARLRLFSALTSLLLLPALFWLAFEVFESKGVGLAAAAFAAVSPYMVEYGQQAREYGLWAVVICLSSALLLRALKRDSPALWIAYGAAMAIGFYTHLFMFLVALSHAVFVLGVRRAAAPNAAARFAGALAPAVLLAVPWLLIVLSAHAGQSIDTAHGYAHQDLKSALYAWLLTLGSLFTDLEFLGIRYFAIVAFVVAAEACALIALVRRAPFAQWWFVVTLFGGTALLQVGNSGLTDMPRYLTPAVIAVDLGVAWWVVRLLRASSPPVWRRMGAALLAVLIAVCLVDDGRRVTTAVWWTNAYGEPLAPIARTINADRRPVLVVGLENRQDPDWEVLYDESPFLSPRDLVTYLPLRTVLASPSMRRDDIYVLTRFSHKLPRVRGVRLRPISVQIAAYGYALLEARRGGRVAKRATWLWRVTPGAIARRRPRGGTAREN